MSLELHSEVVDFNAAQDWADRITAFWQRTVEGIRDMCTGLAQARANLGPTGFRLMFADQDTHVERPIPLSYNAGGALAKVGLNAVLRDSEHVQSLPSGWGAWVMLDRLQRFDSDRFVTAIETGDIHSGSERGDLAQLLAKWRYERRQLAFHEAAATSGERWEMGEPADFRDVTIDEPVDAILTDPPYPDEYLPLWVDLGKWAADQLRPGGLLIAWSGVRRLPEILTALTGSLVYGWTLMLDMPGSHSRFIYGNFLQTWKPIVVFLKDQWPPHDWGPDRIVSLTREKSRYEWEQSVEPAMNALDRFVSPGGLVVDPFCGVGSFGIATLRSGRRFRGIEIDEQRHAESCERLGQWIR